MNFKLAGIRSIPFKQIGNVVKISLLNNKVGTTNDVYIVLDGKTGK